jgi:flagellar FliJ protein
MKRFNFRLESLLEIRKRAEEEIKKDLAKKNNEILLARRDQKDLVGRLESFFIDEKKQRMKVLDLLALRTSISYRRQIEKDIGQKFRRIEELSAEKDRIMELLIKARKESKVLELLKDKKLAEWKKEYKMEEQKFIDDVSQKAYIRKTTEAISREREFVSG